MNNSAFFFSSSSENEPHQAGDLVLHNEDSQIATADELHDIAGMMRLALHGARQATRACAAAWLADRCGVTVSAA